MPFLGCPFSPPLPRSKSTPYPRSSRWPAGRELWSAQPGFGISQLSSLGSHKRRLQAGRARTAPAAPDGDGIPGVTPPLPGWRLSAVPASRMAEKGSSLGNRGCSSSGIRLCSKLSQNELLQQRFCLQVEGKNKSCGKPHDFYLEQIFFWLLEVFLEDPQREGNDTAQFSQRSYGLGDPGWMKGGETETPLQSSPTPPSHPCAAQNPSGRASQPALLPGTPSCIPGSQNQPRPSGGQGHLSLPSLLTIQC